MVKYSALTYDQAEELYAAGDIKGAQALYASIPDHAEAKKRDQACRYLLAKEAAGMMEYTTVLEMLKGIPDDYEQTRRPCGAKLPIGRPDRLPAAEDGSPP